MRVRVSIILVMPLSLVAGLLSAQKNTGPTGSPQSQSQSPSGGSSAPAQGITWPSSVWESLTDLKKQEESLEISPKDLLKKREKSVKISPEGLTLPLLCYSLDVTTGSLSTPPFVFRQVDRILGMEGSCIATANAKKPLLANGFIGVAIDARHVPTGRMRSFNLTLTTAAGQPINLYPVRPSAGASSAGNPTSGQTTSSAGGNTPHETAKQILPITPPPPLPTWGKIYYLIWPQALAGDVIPTVNVSLAYTPPVPGSPWQINTVYPEGSIVSPPDSKPLLTCPIDKKPPPPVPTFTGHYFVASSGGISSESANPPPVFCVQGIQDGTVWWVDSGTSTPTNAPTTSDSQSQGAAQPSKGAAPATINNWTSRQPYVATTVVYSPVTSHYYVAQNSGTSGDVSPFSNEKLTPDGTNLSWMVFGRNPPPVGATPTEWDQQTGYQDGQAVYDSDSQLYFVAVIAKGNSYGTPGQDNPFTDYLKSYQVSDPDPAATGSTPVHWLDVGSTAPVIQQPLKMATPLRDINTPYKPGDVVFDPASGHFFTAIYKGRSSNDPSLVLAANQHSPFSDGKPTDLAVAAILEDFLDVKGNTSFEWMSMANSDAVQACANKPPYPEWSDGAKYQINYCIRDLESAMIFQLRNVAQNGDSARQDSSLVPAVPANFSYAVWIAQYLATTIQEQFVGPPGQTLTGTWKPKVDPNADPSCTNQNNEKYPDLRGSAAFRNNDCAQETISEAIFQLSIDSNDLVSPLRRVILTAHRALSEEISFQERFRDQKHGVDDLTWNTPPIGPCKKPADPDHPYDQDYCVNISNPSTQFQLETTGSTGPFTPYPQITDFQDTSVELFVVGGRSIDPVQWEDIGTSAPSLVSGGEPADQTVEQSYTLTQVHPKYYFDLSTGLVASTTHNHTFGWATNAPGIYTPIQTASNPVIDAVLFFTVYWPKLPMDAESPWRWKDAVPAPTLGMSFTSPTSNFYIGLSSEVRRNVQFVFGLSTAEPQYLSSTSVSATNMGSPQTAQRFTRGGFLGFSLNVSGFIQTVLGGK